MVREREGRENTGRVERVEEYDKRGDRKGRARGERIRKGAVGQEV